MDKDELIVKQTKLDTAYRVIFFSVVILVVLLIGGLFAQVYSLSAQINSQVDKIVSNQTNNRSITDKQNSLVLGYLICIGKIAPEKRTDEIIKSCVVNAQKADIKNIESIVQ